MSSIVTMAGAVCLPVWSWPGLSSGPLGCVWFVFQLFILMLQVATGTCYPIFTTSVCLLTSDCLFCKPCPTTPAQMDLSIP